MCHLVRDKWTEWSFVVGLEVGLSTIVNQLISKSAGRQLAVRCETKFIRPIMKLSRINLLLACTALLLVLNSLAYPSFASNPSEQTPKIYRYETSNSGATITKHNTRDNQQTSSQPCKTQSHTGLGLAALDQIVFQPQGSCSSWQLMLTSQALTENVTEISSEKMVSSPWLQIERLDVSHNKLVFLNNSSGIEQMVHLIELNLSHNKLEHCDENSLARLTRLTVLDFAHNQLATLPPRLFTPLRHLEVLKLSNNKLASLSAGNTPVYLPLSLLELDLASNLLVEIGRDDAIAGLSHLLSLRLLDNPIRLIEHRALERLKSLKELSLPQSIETTTAPSAASLIGTSSVNMTKSGPSILRPSIEQVASLLSRKYLNLEQHKQSQVLSTISKLEEKPEASISVSSDSSRSSVAASVEPEREITLDGRRQTAPSSAAHSTSKLFAKELGYLETSSVSDSNKQQKQQVKTRNKQARRAHTKTGFAELRITPPEPADELMHCQKYLQLRHSPANESLEKDQRDSGFDPSLIASPSTNIGQPLACSCSLSPARFLDFDQDESVGLDGSLTAWLNCDHAQLIGSQSFAASSKKERVASEKSIVEDRDLELLTRFSQRDSGLQVLFAQKFHYLGLFHLKSIDMSENRLREIQLDAFHGLENSLEHLNLASNLLGDSRLVSNSNQENELLLVKFTFHTDELSRLTRLKWLSLKSNQISKISPNLFVKQSSSTTNRATSAGANNAEASSSRMIEDSILIAGQSSELRYLDISDNLLTRIPSASIQHLQKLRALDLSVNRIQQLDRFSKFPASIKSLDLSHNVIRSVRDCDLIDLPNLVELNLSHNLLRQLDSNAFVPSASTYLAAAAAAAAIDEDSRQSTQFAHGTNVAIIDQQSDHTLTKREIEQKTSQSEEAEILDAQETSSDDQEEPTDDIEVSESIISAFKNRFSPSSGASSTQAQLDSNKEQLTKNSDEQSTLHHFNATLHLNLSYNLLEQLPGDSLLKFSRLQVLDLSYNRIRSLDANYLCSIYNLVENLRRLSLAGNLLSLQRDTHVVSLNKLFGCLQRLERLELGTNRLNGDGLEGAQVRNSSIETLSSSDPSDDPLQGEASEQNEFDRVASNTRLHLKFGESFGSKYLRALDLSDNQIHLMPSIEQATTRKPPPMIQQNSSNEQTRRLLDEWMLSSHLHLDELDLSYNYIERLEESDFEHLYNLKRLHLDFNKISSITTKLMSRFTALEIISIRANRLATLEPINELFQRSLRSLRSLNLANNRLTHWPEIRKMFQSQEAHHNDQQLLQVSANVNSNNSSKNSATDQSRAATDEVRQYNAIEIALEELNLEGNLLTTGNISVLFEQFVYLRSLKRLNLSFNLINKVRSDWFKFANKNLEHLQLSGNKISNVDLGAFALNQLNALKRLDMNYNLLKELKRRTFDSMPAMRELNLGHNLIHTINSETFSQLSSLQVLRLNNNKLTSWKCEYFSQLCNTLNGHINVDLATLIASHQTSERERLDADYQPTVSAISSLIELDLSHNSLSQLRTNSIAVHTHLQRLNLAHNKLSFIPHDLFKATTLVSSSSGRQIHLVSSLKLLNLAHNRIQTLDNINFKPLRNLVALDLSYNELQNLGVDILSTSGQSASQQHLQANQKQNNHRKVLVISGNNLTNLLVDRDEGPIELVEPATLGASGNRTARLMHVATLSGTDSNWPSLCKLRKLDLSFNSLNQINQSLLTDLSPFAALKLNLSHNLLDSTSLPNGLYSRMMLAPSTIQDGSSTLMTTSHGTAANRNNPTKTVYELVFTLKLESIDLSHNRLGDYPSALLDSHHSSMESCDLSYNRIQNLPQNSNSLIQAKLLDLQFNPLSREANELLLTESRSARSLNLAATRLYAIQQATLEESLIPDSYLSVKRGLHHKRQMVNQTSQLDLIRSISKPINAPYLRHLNLSSNQIVWLAANVFDKLTALQTLDLSHNQLTRLHLLNNQLAHLSLSLEHINLASNLFTNIDQTDLSQLSNLKYLDISHLFSLQKLDCNFVSKLPALRTLRAINYPSLRQNIQHLLGVMDSPQTSDRLKQKIRMELIYSTFGGHCFRLKGLADQRASDANGTREMTFQPHLSWSQLDRLELELFNDFSTRDPDHRFAGMKLSNQLHQMLGPNLKFLTLTGLNLTSIGDLSLLGIASNELQLKISYTSLAHLPLKQILTSISKRTLIHLDLRHNNMQTVDLESLAWLDELQQAGIASSSKLYSGTVDSQGANQPPLLLLSNNPFRCDCNMRPFWLWLNQRWESTDSSQYNSEDSSGDNWIGSITNYWLRFHSLSQTSDLKCFHPLKLRGKIAQHVYYNDFVCKYPAQSALPNRASSSGNTKRRLNETTSLRSSDSYYLTSLGDSGSEMVDELDADDSDYSISETDIIASDSSSLDYSAEPPVRITRFNRYPTWSSTHSNASAYFALNFPVAQSLINSIDLTLHQTTSAPEQQLVGDDQAPIASRIGKRDQYSNPLGDASQHYIQQPADMGMRQFSKRRPNTVQKHGRPTHQSALNGQEASDSQSDFRDGSDAQSSKRSFNIRRSSLLSDFDVIVLTVASVAMALMAFVIMSVCLVRYRWDTTNGQARHRDVLPGQGRLIMSSSHALLTTSSKSRISHASFESSGSGQKHDKSDRHGGLSNNRHNIKAEQSPTSSCSGEGPGLTRLNLSSSTAPAVLLPVHEFAADQAPQPPTLRPTHSRDGGGNFLMRSPTIRRMHGMAATAGESLLKYTLRAYPSASGTKRRRLFIQNNLTTPGISQLTTSRMVKHIYNNEQRMLDGLTLDNSALSGCPLHAFDALNNSQQHASRCFHCDNLLLTLRRSYSIGRDGPGHLDIAGEDYVPPKVIQALARQLDSRHEAKLMAWNETSAKRMPLGTFGKIPLNNVQPQHKHSPYQEAIKANSKDISEHNGEPVSISSSKQDSRNNQRQQQTNIQKIDNQVNRAQTSQIPTIDVDGRFTYQSDCQQNDGSLMAKLQHQQNANGSTTACSTAGYLTPASTIATGNEEMFVLVCDTPSRLTECSMYASTTTATQQNKSHLPEQSEKIFQRYTPASSFDRRQATMPRKAIEGADIQATKKSTHCPQQQAVFIGHDSASIMQDECSRSSSPVAYGFMRSSPSATTISSNTMTAHNHNVVNRSPIDSQLMQQPIANARYLATTKRSSFLGSQVAGVAQSSGKQGALASSIKMIGSKYGASVDNNNDKECADKNTSIGNGQKDFGTEFSQKYAQIVRQQAIKSVSEGEDQVVVSRL